MEKKPTLLEKVRASWRQRQYARAKRVLTHMVNAKDPEIYKDIRDCANVIAKGMCMKWLDERRVNHCVKCPNTETLLSIQGVYMCSGHATTARPARFDPVRHG